MRAARLSSRLLVLAALASLLAVGLGRLIGLANRERPVLFYSNRDGHGDLYILDAATFATSPAIPPPIPAPPGRLMASALLSAHIVMATPTSTP